jgi:hypothetical protein
MLPRSPEFARKPAVLGISGISMRCSSRSTVRSTTCGGRATRTAPCWTFWSPPTVTPRPPPGSSVAAHGIAVRAAGAGHRQAGQLRHGPPTADVQCGAPSIEVSEQSGRELPSTHPGARTRDETIPIVRWHSTVPVRLQRHINPLPAPPSPTHRSPSSANNLTMPYLFASRDADHHDPAVADLDRNDLVAATVLHRTDSSVQRSQSLAVNVGAHRPTVRRHADEQHTPLGVRERHDGPSGSIPGRACLNSTYRDSPGNSRWKVAASNISGRPTRDTGWNTGYAITSHPPKIMISKA